MTGKIPRDPLNYKINTPDPLNLYRFDRAPTPDDYRNFKVGDFWLDEVGLVLYFLSFKGFETATWVTVASPASSFLTVTGDVGGAVSPDGLGNLDIVGGTDISVTGNPGTNTLTIDSSATGITSVTADVGSATPALGNFDILGGVGISTVGAADTITVDLNSPVLVIHGGTGLTSLTDHGVMIGSGTSPVTMVTPGAVGTVLTSNGPGLDPVFATVPSGVIPWTEVTGTTQAAAVNNGYITNNAALVSVNLPAVAAIGDVVYVDGKGAGLFEVVANAGQTIHFLTQDTSVGGTVTATERYGNLSLRCITADTEWTVERSQGNFTVA